MFFCRGQKGKKRGFPRVCIGGNWFFDKKNIDTKKNAYCDGRRIGRVAIVVVLDAGGVVILPGSVPVAGAW